LLRPRTFVGTAAECNVRISQGQQFFVVLMNLGWLPQEMVIVLVVIIILAGGLYIGSLMYDAYILSLE
jgi:hypothetical protein